MLSSYRTYEEWKRRYTIVYLLFYLVLTVPMRNGNIDQVVAQLIDWNVLTVPMRNGNSPISLVLLLFQSGSYRTYEEWKLK